jgi:hypothetical protein
MGASQSTGGAAEQQESGAIKTSYYELLGVERTATQDECVMLCLIVGTVLICTD